MPSRYEQTSPKDDKEQIQEISSIDQQQQQQSTDNDDVTAVCASLQSLSICTVESTPERVTAGRKQTKFQGTRPNVKWRSYTADDLVMETGGRYVPMGPDCSHLRQGSALWHEQRSGHFTGSTFATVLGFFERKAARELGIHAFSSHDRALSLQDTMLRGTQSVFDHATRVKMDWGTHHELNAVLTLLNDGPSLKVHETGFWTLPEEHIPLIGGNSDGGFDDLCFDDLPRIGASPDGVVYDSSVSLTEPQYLLEVKCPAPFFPMNNGTERRKTTTTANTTATILNGAVSAESRDNADATKSHPTSDSEQGGVDVNRPKKKEKQKNMYRYLKRKPFVQIPVYYIPQIQAQMLCSGIHKCIFVSYTPTNGMTVFEMDFDPEYAHLMLKMIRDFYQRYVKPGLPSDDDDDDTTAATSPPDIEEDYFFDQDDYQELLKRTKDLRANCPVVKTINDVAKSPKHLDLFLDSDTEEEELELELGL